MAKKNETDAQAGFAEPDKRLTPLDIQEKLFTRSFKGYNEREVDGFLDQVTEELARMHAESKALREQLEEIRATRPLDVSPLGAAGGAVSGGDADRLRELTSSFITRERGFLQSLAAIVQQHAEAMKEDVRAAKTILAPAPQPAVTEHPATAPERETAASEESSAVAAPAEQAATPALVDLSDASTSLAEPAAVASPAQPASAEEPDGATIREMFWGED